MIDPTKSKLTAIAMVMSLGLFSAQASATFFFDQRGSFDHDLGADGSEFSFGALTGSFTSFTSGLFPVEGAEMDGYVDGTYSMVAWGENTNLIPRSSLTIETYSEDSDATHLATGGASPTAMGDANGMVDLGEWWTITRLTQNNMVIPAGGTPLWTMDAIANFEIWDNDAHSGAPVLSDLGSRTNIEFSETDGSGVADFYKTPIADFAPLNFSYMGMDFAVDFRVVPVAAASVDVGGTNPGYITVTTQEVDISMLDVQFQITKVPEPGSLALMSLGLIMVGGLATRRKQS